MKIRAAVLFLTAAVSSQATFYVATDHTGAQTQIDTDHTSEWLFLPNVDFQLSGGLFEMKAGSSASDTITLALYQGMSAAGTLLTSVTLDHSQFCAQAGNCGQFSLHTFLFPAPFSLQAGLIYYVSLTSMAPDVQSKAYFIKSDNTFISDSLRNPVNPPPVTFDPPPPEVPEPGTAALMIVGAGVGVAVRLRTAQN
ncbi:MAG: PEP-CTERM sorting domain-containing protein [Bryobacteraceae bacterium]